MARNVLLTIGLVSVPVKVDTAIEAESTPSFKTVCDGTHATKKGHPPTAIKQKYVCPTCQNDDRNTLKKAAPTEDGKYVIVTPEQIKAEASLPDELKNTMSLAAHPLDSVLDATIATGKVYNLLPGKGVSDDQYALFVAAAREAAAEGLALCTVWAYRDKPAMYLLQPRGEHLMAHELAWPSEVKEVKPINGTPDQALLGQFKTLIGMSKADFDPAAYRDQRADSIAALISKGKAVEAGDEPEGPSVKGGGTNVADQLGAALAALGAGEDTKPAKKKAAKKKAS